MINLVFMKKVYTFVLSLRSQARRLIAKSILGTPNKNYRFQVKSSRATLTFLKRFFYWAKMRYISQRYNKHIQLPFSLIKRATEENWLDSLIYFIWLKKQHTRPVFYGYSLRKLALILECSPNTVKYHLAILSKQGLCCVDGANLWLKSTTNMRTDDKLMVPVCISKNKAEQRMYLRYSLIKRNIHNQVRANSKKNDIIKFLKGEITNLKQYKALRKLAKNQPSLKKLESSVQNEITLSNKSFGRLTNRSQSTGIKIQKAFNKMSLLSSQAKSIQVSVKKTDRRGFFEQCLTSSHFLTNRGFVFKRLSNTIVLTPQENSSIQQTAHP